MNKLLIVLLACATFNSVASETTELETCQDIIDAHHKAEYYRIHNEFLSAMYFKMGDMLQSSSHDGEAIKYKREEIKLNELFVKRQCDKM